MSREELEHILEVYTLTEILDALDLEHADVLVMLEAQGYFDDFPLPLPLEGHYYD